MRFLIENKTYTSSLIIEQLALRITCVQGNTVKTLNPYFFDFYIS